jgi:hypothetical protein
MQVILTSDQKKALGVAVAIKIYAWAQASSAFSLVAKDALK